MFYSNSPKCCGLNPEQASAAGQGPNVMEMLHPRCICRLRRREPPCWILNPSCTSAWPQPEARNGCFGGMANRFLRSTRSSAGGEQQSSSDPSPGIQKLTTLLRKPWSICWGQGFLASDLWCFRVYFPELAFNLGSVFMCRPYNNTDTVGSNLALV